MDEIHSVFLKASDVVELSWLEHWMEIWDWQTDDDVVLLASSVGGLQLTLEHWTSLQPSGRNENPERVACSLRIRGDLLPQVEEFNYQDLVNEWGERGVKG